MKKVLVDLGNFKYKWVEDNSLEFCSKKSSRSDPTIDQVIQDKGGILSHLDNKVYTTKGSYLESIRQAGCHIKDY